MNGRQEGNSLLTATACAFYSADYWSASQQAHRLSNTPQTRAEGLYWEIKSDQKLAIAALKRAEAYAPESPKMHVVIGDVYRERQHFDDAAAEYDKALSLSPSDRGALFGLSVAQFMQGHTDDALSKGERLLKGDPHDARTNLLVGEALVKLRRFVEAEIYLERSLEGDSELRPRAHALLGQCFRENGDDTKAIREFDQALSGDDDGSVHYQLAVLYLKSGDRATAAALMDDSKRIRADRLRRAAISFQEVQQNNADANNVK
jgi:tetratricopeptide (TPR) repeat protein